MDRRRQYSRFLCTTLAAVGLAAIGLCSCGGAPVPDTHAREAMLLESGPWKAFQANWEAMDAANSTVWSIGSGKTGPWWAALALPREAFDRLLACVGELGALVERGLLTPSERDAIVNVVSEAGGVEQRTDPVILEIMESDLDSTEGLLDPAIQRKGDLTRDYAHLKPLLPTLQGLAAQAYCVRWVKENFLEPWRARFVDVRKNKDLVEPSWIPGEKKGEFSATMDALSRAFDSPALR